jgi:hypothetical protein
MFNTSFDEAVIQRLPTGQADAQGRNRTLAYPTESTSLFE